MIENSFGGHFERCLKKRKDKKKNDNKSGGARARARGRQTAMLKSIIPRGALTDR